MRLLVTGGAGYIGSIVARHLITGGHDVVVLDNLERGHREAVPPEAGFVECDLRDLDAVRAAVEDSFSAVLHFAAFALVAESVEHPERYYRNNVLGTLNLLDAMREARVGRLVFSSTCAVYGEPDEVPIPEGIPTRPTNPYGASKLAADRMISDFCAAHGLGAVSLRYFNVAGASGDLGEDHEPETHLIPNVLRAAMGINPAVKIFGTDYPDARRHRDPRLHPHRRPERRSPSRAGSDARGRAPDLQPRQRQRILGPGGDRRRGGGHGHVDPDRRGRAASGRPADARCGGREDPP